MRKNFSNYRCTKHLLALLLFIIAHNATQAAIIAASSPATVLSSTTPFLMNADMVRCPMIGSGTDYLSAIVHDDANSSSIVSVHVLFGVNKLTFNINNAWHPDVAIADDYASIGNNYLLCITYNDPVTMESHLEVFRINGIGTSTMTQASLYNVNLTPSIPTKYPRIDMFADDMNMVGGIVPSLHEFVVTWAEGPCCTPSAEYRDVNNSLGTSGVLNSITLAGTGAYGIDVAVTTDITTRDKYAYFLYADASGHLNSEEWSVATSTSTRTVLTTPAFSTNDWLYTRIEAMSLHDPGLGWVKWNGVTGHNITTGGTSKWEIYGYNDLSLSGVSLSNGITNSQSRFGAVAAGIGQPGSSTDIGNVQYTTIWYDMANAANYARYVDASANTLSADEYEVNCSGCTPTGRAGQPLAVTNSSNDGYDILTAWYDGSNIVYKKTGNSASYKPLSIQDAPRDELKLYPNPSADVLHIANAGNCKYTITDISGRIVMIGELVNGSVDVAQLKNGGYTITINSTQHAATCLAFSKE